MKTMTARRVPLTIAVMAWLVVLPAAAGPTLLPGLSKSPEEMEVQTVLDAVLADLARQRGELIKIQRELVRFTAINPEDGGDGEEAKARWIEEWLAAEKLPPAERVDCPDDRVASGVRPSLILRHAPWQPGRPTLWIVNHLDNSPPGDVKSWTASPFALRVDGDRIYGLGVQDGNDGIAASLLLLRALHRNYGVPPLNLGVLLVAGEKKGDFVGLANLLEKRPDLLTPGDHVLVTSYGEGNGDAIETGEKGVLWLKVSVRGKQSAAAFPHMGKNALAIGAELIAALPRLSERFPTGNPLFNPPVSTFIPTKVEANITAINQIAGEFVFYIDSRFLFEHPLEEVRAALEELAAGIARKHETEIALKTVLERPAAPVTPPDAPMVAALSRAIERHLRRPARLVGIGGSSSATPLRQMGFPAVAWQMPPFSIYGVDESMSLTANLTEAAILARLLFDPALASAGRREAPQ